MFGLCKYKDSLGKPNEGVHSYRVLDIAIVDVIMTLIIGSIFNFNIFNLFLLGIISHRLFCVRTTVDKILFPDL